MFERFTDRARRVIVLAQEEARALQHNYIGTEHLLLGLIREGEGVAAKALASKGVELDATRKQVEEMIGKGNAAPNGHIPFTPHAKQVLEFSLREALQLGHSYIGTWGTPGAYHAMRHGTVDESWARAHHAVWYEEVKAGVPPGTFDDRTPPDQPPDHPPGQAPNAGMPPRPAH